jgi:peptidoglycan/xylan/chitin deacetylase (PgdA/CDA1 family)
MITEGKDFVARGARVTRLGRDFRWPGGRHVAVVFNVAYEGWPEDKAPGIGPMGNPLPGGAFDTNAVSWAAYGQVRGIERILRVLDKLDLSASVMANGIFAERTPDLLKALVGAGHELVAHSYSQNIVPATLTAEQVKADIVKTTDALTAAAGVRPRGWISPRGTPSPDSARFLIEAGYLWQGDVFDDDRPYVQTLPEGRLVAIPLTMDINDLPHAMRFGRSPRQYIEMFEDLLAHALTGEDEAVMIDVTVHGHVFGHPAGAWALETVGRTVQARDDVFVARRDEIAELVLEAVG